MPRRSYLTVPDELLETADAIGDFLEARGYRVSVEPQDVAYPFTPTLRAHQRSTTLYVEVDQRINLDRLARWHGYGRSSSRDTRVATVVRRAAPRSARSIEELRRLRVGLYVVDTADVTEMLEPHDLALNFQLPDISSTPQRFRAVIGPAHEKVQRGDWRDGFTEACGVLEEQAKKYLKEGIDTGRVVILTSRGNPQTLTPQGIDRMTMGGLQNVFQRIQNQNLVDKRVYSALARVRADRNAATHARTRQRTEDALRRNVGQHLWAIDTALRAMMGVA